MRESSSSNVRVVYVCPDEELVDARTASSQKKLLVLIKRRVMALDHLSGLKEATEMTHLPGAGDGQDHQLNNSPCHGVSVGRLTLVTELSLVVLLTFIGIDRLVSENVFHQIGIK